MNNNLKSLLVLAALTLSAKFCLSQISISGPSCVLPGAEYQYNISGQWDSATVIKICITGGKATGTDSSCQSSKPLPFVRVIWDENISAGDISISTDTENASLTISITAALDPGIIDSAISLQRINFNKTPALINCTAARGGSCSPRYQYQWQQSEDNIKWEDIENATEKDLAFIEKQKDTKYYRRKVTETVSGTVAYSSGASVIVKPEKQQ